MTCNGARRLRAYRGTPALPLMKLRWSLVSRLIIDQPSGRIPLSPKCYNLEKCHELIMKYRPVPNLTDCFGKITDEPIPEFSEGIGLDG